MSFSSLTSGSPDNGGAGRRSEKPQSLAHQWTRAWPGGARDERAPFVHLVSFDTERFAQLDAAAAPTAGLGWNDSLSRSVPRRQAEFFFGRWAVRAALLAQGLPARPVGIGTAREPLWPAEVVGSITHINGLAAAAVAPAATCVGLGLDAERVARGEDQAALRGLAVDERELKLLRELGDADLDRWVTIAFSAKESLYKAAFPTVRRFFGFEAARVASVDPQAGTLVLEIVELLDERFTPRSQWSVAIEALGVDVVLTGLMIEP